MPSYRFLTQAQSDDGVPNLATMQLADDDAAKREALLALGDLVRENVLAGDRVFRCRVEDDLGRVVSDVKVELAEQ